MLTVDEVVARVDAAVVLHREGEPTGLGHYAQVGRLPGDNEEGFEEVLHVQAPYVVAGPRSKIWHRNSPKAAGLTEVALAAPGGPPSALSTIGMNCNQRTSWSQEIPVHLQGGAGGGVIYRAEHVGVDPMLPQRTEPLHGASVGGATVVVRGVTCHGGRRGRRC